MIRSALFVLLTALPACGGSDDCPDLGTLEDRDACYAERAPTLFDDDPKQADALVLQIENQALRDLVNLNLTRDHAPKTDERCRRIKASQLRERCMAIVSRPHLHPFLEADGK